MRANDLLSRTHAAVSENIQDDKQRYEQGARDVVKGADPDHIARVRKLDPELLRKHVSYAWDRVNSGEYKLNRPNLEENNKDIYNQVYQLMIKQKPEFMLHAPSADVKKAIIKAMGFGSNISVNDLATYAYGLLKSNDLEENDPIEENLRKWFKEKWVRFGPDGKIRGDCARGSESEGKPKCLPQARAQALGKKGRASSAAKKRREDPNPERRGAAKNVATKVKEDDLDENCWKGYHKEGNKELFGKTVPNCVKNEAVEEGHADQQRKVFKKNGEPVGEVGIDRESSPGVGQYYMKHYASGKDLSGYDSFDEALEELKHCMKQAVKESHESCPECGGAMYPDTMINEKQDACYFKVKSRYKVWPSAYASGALVQCRKKGAANWGNKSKNESTLKEFAPGGAEGNSPYAYGMALKEMAQLYAEGEFDLELMASSAEQNESDAGDIDRVAQAFLNRGMEAGREAYKMLDDMDSYLSGQGFNVDNDIHAEYQKDVERYRASPPGPSSGSCSSKITS